MVMMLLAVTAAALSGYLTWVTLEGSTAAGCGEGGCRDVLASRWSSWLGIPVSLGGLVVYGSILTALLFTHADEPPRKQRAAWRILLPLAMMALAAAVWFLAIQFVAIGELCVYCLTIHGSGILLAGMILFSAPLGVRADAASRVHIPTGTAALLAGGGLAAFAVVIAGQLLMPPQSTAQLVETRGFTIDATQAATLPSEVAGLPPAPTNPVGGTTTAITTTTTSRIARPERRIYPFDPRTPINTYDEPILGSPDAEHVILEMFDYACVYCRQMHEHLEAARQRYGRQFAVIAIPVPLNRRCNQHVIRTARGHEDSCDLARTALAVWLNRPQDFEAFHHWLFTGDRPRTADEAREHAAKLFGSQQEFDAAFNQHAVTARLVRYADLFDKVGKGVLPKLVLGRYTFNGAAQNPEELFVNIEKVLRIRPAQ